MSKVIREVAEKEIEKWLDVKRIAPSKRESYATYTDTLINAVMDGDLVLNTDNTFTYKLKFASGEGAAISALKIKPRMSVYERSKATQGIKADDGEARLLALIAGITDQPRNIIAALDTEDASVLQAIAVFLHRRKQPAKCN